MDLLLEALLLPEPQARQVWAQWREAIDVSNLPYASQQLIPALNPAFPEWLEQDSAARIFKGIVRQVWTHNQLRLRRAIEVDTRLKRADVRPLVAGPLVWSLRARAPAIRPIPYLTFLLARADVRKAFDALIYDGWEPYGDLPSDQALDWYDHLWFHQESLQLTLHWRLLASPPEDALECEQAFLSPIDQIEWNHHILSTTSLEATMLHILCSQRDGDLAWQADVALAGTAGIDWPMFLKLARRFAPSAIDRLRQLQPFSRLAIPPLPLNDPGLLRRKFQYVWKLYRAHSYHRKEALSWSGFVEFLAMSFARKSMQAVAFCFPKKSRD